LGEPENTKGSLRALVSASDCLPFDLDDPRGSIRFPGFFSVKFRIPAYFRSFLGSRPDSRPFPFIRVKGKGKIATFSKLKTEKSGTGIRTGSGSPDRPDRRIAGPAGSPDRPDHKKY